MKFGVLQFFSWPGRRVPLSTVYERALERIEIMDQSGYDAVWLAEHHFTTYSVCPSVHLMAMHVAGRTKNLRIGTAVSLVPLYHPLRIAEEIALLDVLSGGRVNWGAGRGFDPTEFRAYGVPQEESSERFREGVDIVIEAWRNEKLDWDGRHWHFEGIEVLPKPLQQPHPPVWVAATSPPAIEWASERGYSILMDPHSSHASIGQKLARFRTGLLAHGHSPEGREIPVARLIAVAETDAKAEQVARQGAAWTVGAYANPSKNPGFAQAVRGSGETDPAKRDPVERYVRDVAIHGSPERVIDELERLREEIPLEYLLCSPLSHESFVLFTERVLPKLL